MWAYSAMINRVIFGCSRSNTPWRPNLRCQYMKRRFVSPSSHLEGYSTSVGSPGYCHPPVRAVKNVDARRPILLRLSSDVINIYLNFSLPLGITHSTLYLQHCSGHMAIISTSDMSILPWSLLRQVCCYRLNWCCLPDHFIFPGLSGYALYLPQYCHFCLIHQHIILIVRCPTFITICYRRYVDR